MMRRQAGTAFGIRIAMENFRTMEESNDVWVPTRMEREGEWYFVGLLGLKLDGLMMRG